MSVDFTKLKSFVKIVDAGSVSRAAGILRTAQPALSQQIAALESYFKHKLLRAAIPASRRPRPASFFIGTPSCC
jgi:hypothetical protein